MAKLLVTSLLRTGWQGEIVIFRNRPRPIFSRRYFCVHEERVDADLSLPWHQVVGWKYRVRDRLRLTGIGKVLFLDCDCVALRDINDLLFGSWDIYTASEPGRMVEPPFNGYLDDSEMSALKNRPGLNSGNFGVRASRYLGVMAEWERIDLTPPLRPNHHRNQHSWNRLILNTPLRHRDFLPRQIQFPFLHNAVYSDYSRAAIVHAADRSPEEKLSLLYGLWMGAFGQDRFHRVVS